MKAAAAIEQVDVSTFKVVATFPSDSEAEQQSDMPRTSIRRDLLQVLAVLYGRKAPDYSKGRTPLFCKLSLLYNPNSNSNINTTVSK